jgi:hypothetical protein
MGSSQIQFQVISIEGKPLLRLVVGPAALLVCSPRLFTATTCEPELHTSESQVCQITKPHNETKRNQILK